MQSRFTNIKRIAATGLLGLTFLFLTLPIYAATSNEVREVAKAFMCNCGCNKMLPVCDMQCGKNLRGVITKKIDAGWSKDKVVNSMVNNYNEQILAAPTKKGFNLIAWITPFVVWGLAGIGLAMVIISWVKATEKKDAEAAATVSSEEKKSPAVDKKMDEYHKKLNEELKDHEW